MKPENDKSWRTWNPHTLGGNGKWKNGTATLENSLAVHQKVNHGISRRPSNSTPRYLPKRNESMCPHKDKHTSVHGHIAPNSPKVNQPECHLADE